MMENSSDETAAKFIDALIQALQTLCHGYLEFKTGVEIIGHINLSVDKENSHDYILKEKVCRLEGNSSFISNSFHAVPEGGTAHDSHTADTDSQGWRQGVSAFEDDNNPDLNGLSSPDSYQKGVRRKSSEEETGQFHPAKCSRLGNFSNTTTTTDVSAFPSRCVSPEDSKLGLHMTVSSAESEASHGCGELETGLHLALAAVAEVSVAKSKLTAAQKTGKNVDSSTGCAVDVVRDAFEPMPVQICRKRTDVENSCESVTIIKQEIQEEDSADDSADSSSHGLMRMSYHTGFPHEEEDSIQLQLRDAVTGRRVCATHYRPARKPPAVVDAIPHHTLVRIQGRKRVCRQCVIARRLTNTNRQVETSFMCSFCQVPLCHFRNNCFRDYHYFQQMSA